MLGCIIMGGGVDTIKENTEDRNREKRGMGGVLPAEEGVAYTVVGGKGK